MYGILHELNRLVTNLTPSLVRPGPISDEQTLSGPKVLGSDSCGYLLVVEPGFVHSQRAWRPALETELQVALVMDLRRSQTKRQGEKPSEASNDYEPQGDTLSVNTQSWYSSMQIVNFNGHTPGLGFCKCFSNNDSSKMNSNQEV